MNFEESVVIKQPANKVFKFLSNFRGHKKFALNYKETKQAEKGTMKLGTELFTSTIFLGKRLETNCEVTDFEPNKHIVYKSMNGPVPSKVEYELEDLDGDKTKVTLRYEIEPGSYFRMEEIFLRPRIGEQVKVSVEKLKKLVEERARKAAAKAKQS